MRFPAIGSAIRQRRKRLGMTLQAFADESGLSVAFLSQVERDQASPSLTSLSAMSEALGVGVSYFLGTPRPGQIVRRGANPEYLDFGSEDVTYMRLSGVHEERKLEALKIVIPPRTDSPPSRRDGEGFWYVMEGQLDVWIGEEHFTLRPGDSTHFDQRHPYRMENPGPGPVVLLWVGTPALLD